jgi:DNA-binding GntR family transcriptional regulator
MNRSTEPFFIDLPRRILYAARPGLPKYMMLRDAVSTAIATGTLKPGARLPTESEWAKQLPLSLGTIQRALRMLAEDGLVVRKQGNGTFVAEQEDRTMHAPMHCRFLGDDNQTYLPVYPTVLARFVTQDHGYWTSHLGTDNTLCIERLLDIGHEFAVHSRFYCDQDRIKAFGRLSLNRLAGENFKEIILRETGQIIGRINQFMQYEAMDRNVCKKLAVPAGTLGQKLSIFAYLGRESPIYYQELLIPPHSRIHHLSAEGREDMNFSQAPGHR